MKKSIRRYFHFRTRLFLVISAILTVLAIAVSLIFSDLSTKNSIEIEQISNRILLERITSQVDSLYGQINIAATSITKNPTLQQIILDLNTMNPSQSKEYMEELKQERTIHTILGNMLFSPIISNVLLYNREKNYFYYTGTYLSDTRQIQNALSQNDAAKALEQRTPLFIRPSQSPWIRSDWPVISVLRSFSDNTTTQDTVVEIQVPTQHLDEICTLSSLQGEKELLILDQNGSLIYPYAHSPSILTKEQNKAVLSSIAGGKDSEYHYSYSYLCSSSGETGYTTVLVSNNATIRRQILSYFATSLLTTMAVLAVMLLIVNRILALVTKPLNRLISYVEHLSLDDETKLVLPTNSLDEFEILNTSIAQMVENLKKSIQEIYELQLRESNASLAALQAQIDPHFLYNALNSISAASEIYGSEMTTRMCQQFSSMMRYVTSSRRTVTLAEELGHTKNYLDFMALSNEDNFSYTLEADPLLNSLKLPRLSVQPLTENCFKHGFAQVPPPWRISIRCETDPAGRWEIRIRDNGCGFSAEALDRLKDLPLAYNALEIDGLGLNNTLSRLSIQFDGNFSYEIVNLSPGSLIMLKGALQE